MSRRKKKKSSEPSGEWLVTYADLMTLLLTFFVLLYSFSTTDAQKFRQIAYSLSQAFGGKSGVITNGGNVGPVPINENPGIENNDLGKSNGQNSETDAIYENVEKFLDENNLEGKVSVKKDLRGVIIELQEKILFDSGKAEIKQDSMPVLNKLSELLSRFSNEIIVEGHTDNVPIKRGFYESNWELSADRAVEVVRYLTEQRGLNSSKFMAIGCGEFKPVADNNTAEGRQANRRVNILIESTKKGE